MPIQFVLILWEVIIENSPARLKLSMPDFSLPWWERGKVNVPS